MSIYKSIRNAIAGATIASLAVAGYGYGQTIKDVDKDNIPELWYSSVIKNKYGKPIAKVEVGFEVMDPEIYDITYDHGKIVKVYENYLINKYDRKKIGGKTLDVFYKVEYADNRYEIKIRFNHSIGEKKFMDERNKFKYNVNEKKIEKKGAYMKIIDLKSHNIIKLQNFHNAVRFHIDDPNTPNKLSFKVEYQNLTNPKDKGSKEVASYYFRLNKPVYFNIGMIGPLGAARIDIPIYLYNFRTYKGKKINFLEDLVIGPPFASKNYVGLGNITCNLEVYNQQGKLLYENDIFLKSKNPYAVIFNLKDKLTSKENKDKQVYNWYSIFKCVDGRSSKNNDEISQIFGKEYLIIKTEYKEKNPKNPKKPLIITLYTHYNNDSNKKEINIKKTLKVLEDLDEKTKFKILEDIFGNDVKKYIKDAKF